MAARKLLIWLFVAGLLLSAPGLRADEDYEDEDSADGSSGDGAEKCGRLRLHVHSAFVARETPGCLHVRVNVISERWRLLDPVLVVDRPHRVPLRSVVSACLK
jgi:hypothetical protein